MRKGFFRIGISILTITLLFSLVSCAFNGGEEEEYYSGSEPNYGTSDSEEVETADLTEIPDEEVENPEEKDVNSTTDEAIAVSDIDQSMEIDENNPEIGNIPDISGVWAQKIVAFADSKAAIGEATTLTTTTLLVSHEQVGDKITVKSEVCSIDIDNKLLSIIIPEKFVRALPIIDKTVKLTEEEDGTISYYQPKLWEIRSVRLGNPENELPTDKDDERVEDWDKDAIQGLTAKISGGGWISVIQKTWTELTGAVTSEERIEGLVEWGDHQEVLDASNSLLKLGSKNYQNKDKSKSFFYNVKVADDFTCEEMNEQAAEIFDK